MKAIKYKRYAQYMTLHYRTERAERAEREREGGRERERERERER